jgi:hypothetical protein
MVPCGRLACVLKVSEVVIDARGGLGGGGGGNGYHVDSVLGFSHGHQPVGPGGKNHGRIMEGSSTFTIRLQTSS